MTDQIRVITFLNKLDKASLKHQSVLLNKENKQNLEKIDEYKKYINIISPFFTKMENELNSLDEFSKLNLKFEEIEQRGWVFKGKVWDLIASEDSISKYLKKLNIFIATILSYYKKEESLKTELKYHFFKDRDSKTYDNGAIYSEDRYHFFKKKGVDAYYRDKVDFDIIKIKDNSYFSNFIKRFNSNYSHYLTVDMLAASFYFYTKKFGQNTYELDVEFYKTMDKRPRGSLQYTDNVKKFFDKFRSSWFPFYHTVFPIHLSQKYYETPYLDRIERNNYLIRKIELLLRSKAKKKEKLENVGYVYVLSNQAYPGIYKIGSTYGLVEERAEELTGTGHLHPFKPEFSIRIESAEYFEKSTHFLFKDYRVKQGREFFNLELNKIKTTLKQIKIITNEGKIKFKTGELKKKLGL